MACSLKCGISVSVSGMNETFPSSKDKSVIGFCSFLAPPSQVRVLTSKSNSKILPALSIHFKGQSLAVSDHKSLTLWHLKAPNKFSVNVSVTIFFTLFSWFNFTSWVFILVMMSLFLLISGTSIDLC